ncbi:MAG: extracellular solute-binding protein [Clostridia bacterium]|nr:extracellular solute-binding protein [Clostridia bacterium]
MKQITASLILIAMLAGCVSCGSGQSEDTTPSNDTTASTDTTTAEAVDERYLIKEELPDKTYDDYTIRILMRNSTSPDWIGDMFSEAETGEVISDAIYNRNRTVSERFDVTFELIKSSNNNYETDGVKSILAGDDAYDIIVPHARAAFKYAEQGLCLDWNVDLPYVDLDKPWWDQDARDSFEINGKLYTMVGDISYQALAQTDCVLFNKALFDKYQEEYPYQKVLDDEWTFDEFSRLVKLCSADVNGDGEYKPDTDVFGYVTYQWVGPIQALTTGGGRIVDKDDNGSLVLTINSERTQKVFEDYFKLVDTNNCYLELNRDEKKSIFDCRDVFAQGRAMFIDCALNDVAKMRDMVDDFGIIPAPKYDNTTDKYYTNVDSGTNLFIVPITNQSVECTSVVLEALCAEGYREVIPAYYEVALQTKYTRDDLSVQMLDIIKEGRVFDIGYYYCGGMFASTGYRLVNQPDHNFATFYAQNESAVKTSLQKIVDEYGNQ